jgi:hypothetical protein
MHRGNRGRGNLAPYRKGEVKKMEKCMICEREVEPEEWKANHTGVNFIGALIKIQGHAVCIGNVKKRIIIPNRDRLKEVRQGMAQMGRILMDAELREAPTRGRA